MATASYGTSSSGGGGGGGTVTTSSPISGDGSGGSPITATSAALLTTLGIVSGRTTLGVAASSLTIPGLHGNTEGDYEIEGVLLFATAAVVNIVKVQPNGDTGNAAGETLNPQGATAFAASTAYINLGNINTTTAGTTLSFRIRVKSKAADGLRLIECYGYDTEVGGRTANVNMGVWTDVATELTSIVILSNQATSLLAGSYAAWRSLGFTS